MKLHKFTRSLLLLSLGITAFAQAQTLSMEVWKSPTCGCCNEWISYMQKNGFEVKVNETGNYDAHKRFNIKYVIEGHVPAEDIKRLLAEKPDAIGLSAPGMPIGSPGMDGEAYGGRKDPYDVVLIKKNGESEVFKSYNQ